MLIEHHPCLLGVTSLVSWKTMIQARVLQRSGGMPSLGGCDMYTFRCYGGCMSTTADVMLRQARHKILQVEF